ncbi:uncharacterized protein LOC116266838 [Nymphaea colorata]|nr:uncharacterized protein LOC116266838 [Nymphaea colorata]XP_031504121.1 uncharacterized protein LOC116266838 [Nymphaea colorata]
MMDPRFNHLGFSSQPMSVNAFENLGKGSVFLSGHCTDTVLRLDSPGSVTPQFPPPKGIKRKFGETIDGSLLVLGLGRSPSTSDTKESSETCTLTSAKETTDEETSMDLGLNFSLHLSNDKSTSPNGPPPNAHKVMDMDSTFHLQLSLSTGPAESDITSITPASVVNRNTNETVLVDDGSTCSRWASGSRLPPAVERVFDLNQSSANGDLNDDVPALSNVTPVPKGPAACTSGLTQPRNNTTKTCQFAGCGKGARGASGLCIAHGGGRRCQKPGCNKGAEGRTVYCKAHGGGRRCEYLGCTKSAEGRTDFCIAHGGGRRCGFSGGCTKAARGKSGLCIRHGGGKRCQRENCTKSAEGLSGLCISHGGGRRCQFPKCNKGAQGSTMFCKAHGGGKRCTFPGCTKGAEGSTPLCKGHGGGKRCSFQGGGVCTKSVHGGTKFCVAHGGGKRCAAPDCTKSARGRTNYCVRHGGGKRCKAEGCGKSAQGSTDFCKAHGGGKRCTWGQHLGPAAGQGVAQGPCDRFARGKTGLCQAHSALVQDKRVHGGGTLSQATVSSARHNRKLTISEVVKEKAEVMHIDFASGCGGESSLAAFGLLQGTSKKPVIVHGPSYPVVSLQSPAESCRRSDNATSVPEGRVHGGTLMALLRKGSFNGGNDPSEPSPSYTVSRWP